MSPKFRLASPALAFIVAAACGSADGSTAPTAGSGRLAVLLTDAPFPFDSVKKVDVFVLRIDAKQAEADSAAADQNVDNAAVGGWTTIAAPNKSIDLLALRGGKTDSLGVTTLPNGVYRSLRLILDVERSSITLKDGTELSGASDPGIKFPSAGHSGLKIQLTEPIAVKDSTTKVLVDFDVGSSFVMRGNSLAKNGLLFKPVIKASLVK